MEEDRVGRLAPLTGVLFVVLAVAAVATGQESPKAGASGAHVISYAKAHKSNIELENILFVVAFVALVFFAAALRSYLRRTERAEGLSALVLAGGLTMGITALVVSAIEFALAHNVNRLGAATAQTMNLLDNEIGFGIGVGGFIFGLSAGLAILRGVPLPKWLGWVAIVLGIGAVVPPVSWVALIGFMIWSLIASVLVYLRQSVDRPAVQARPSAAAGAAS